MIEEIEEEEVAMYFSKAVFPVVLPVFLIASPFVFVPCTAHAQQSAPTRTAEASDAQVFAKLCFQCHGPGMWSDLRQDRRGWESLLYRHVGRGALWTEDDIRRMANHLTATFGAQPAKPSK